MPDDLCDLEYPPPSCVTAGQLAAGVERPPAVVEWYTPKTIETVRETYKKNYQWVQRVAEYDKDIPTQVAAKAVLDIFRTSFWDERLKNFSNGDMTFPEMQNILGEYNSVFR